MSGIIMSYFSYYRKVDIGNIKVVSRKIWNIDRNQWGKILVEFATANKLDEYIFQIVLGVIAH